MDVLRTLTSALGHYDADAADLSPRRQLPQGGPADGADRLARRRRSAGCRRAAGRSQPDPVLGHAANFLYMLTGERPTRLATRAFDVALMLHADHELNASTFAGARRGGDADRHLLGDRRRRSAR